MKIIRTGARECFTDFPLEVNWLLTMRCNYRCSYCFDKGGVRAMQSAKKPFSSLEQLKAAVKNIASLNRPWYNVTLSGGEPTIHPHIFELISMLHETFGERLNDLVIITNGSRNAALYEGIATLAKAMHIRISISIHTDHVEMAHILELIEKLSGDIDLNFSLMFNPDKREMVHEIYDIMFDYRKKYWFRMNVVTLRDGDHVDTRYTNEDLAWQKEAIKKFNDLVKSTTSNFPARKRLAHRLGIIHDIEKNGNISTIPAGNRTVELAEGLLQFGGMYCIAHSSVLSIEEDGRFRGMVCGLDPRMYNIYNENSLYNSRDKLIHVVKCTRHVCGCATNDQIPKFLSEEEAKKYVDFAQKRQAELFDEYYASHPIKTI